MVDRGANGTRHDKHKRSHSIRPEAQQGFGFPALMPLRSSPISGVIVPPESSTPAAKNLAMRFYADTSLITSRLKRIGGASMWFRHNVNSERGSRACT